MDNMFQNCSSLTTLDLSNWDLSEVSQTINTFAGCTSLHTVRLDNCDHDTIKKIIDTDDDYDYGYGSDYDYDGNDGDILGLPTDAIDGVTRKIYCKEENAAGLMPPTNWEFVYID
jgi:surface protein